MAELFKKFLPETFAFSDSIMTDFGPVPVKKHKGEGGMESLGARIANNFYNRYVRCVFVDIVIVCIFSFHLGFNLSVKGGYNKT